MKTNLQGKKQKRKYNKRGFIENIIKYRSLYLLLLPGLIFFIVFKYIPYFGLQIAFKNYKPWIGILDSRWVGWKNFELFLSSSFFIQILRNTLIITSLKIVFAFPAPLILALLLNELRYHKLKRFIQTVTYFPHFISWVVIFGLAYIMFNSQFGIVNEIMNSFGIEKQAFLANRSYFRPMLVVSLIWKNTGWGSIVYLAALSGIDPQLYDSAQVDGASRWQQFRHITLPSLYPTIAILFLLRIGKILKEDFQQILVFMGGSEYLAEVGEVFETYVYKTGLLQGMFSLGTAVAFFQAFFGLVLVSTANYIATKKFNYRGLW